MTMHVEAPATGRAAARAYVAASNAVASLFFGLQAEHIARACQSMAARFEAGGRLLVWGDAAERSDVAHVVVEFLHPVVVGKRALPAIALPGDSSHRIVAHLDTFGRGEDILLIFSARALGVHHVRLVASAAARGVLTVVLTGEDLIPPAGDHVFMVPSRDARIVQETHEMTYHVLWELTHVFLDHRGGAA